MPKHSLSIGLVALAAAALMPAQAQADHENRYFGFGYPFYSPYGYNRPPPIYYPPPGVRETAPGIYEYEASPGRWVRVRPGFNNRPRRRQQPNQALRAPEPPPVPKRKPDATDEPDVAVRSAPADLAPERSPEPSPQPAPEQSLTQQAPAASATKIISCEAAIGIVESFGFTDVQSTSCSGDVYGFDAARDGSAYAIKLSAADGALTEVRKR